MNILPFETAKSVKLVILSNVQKMNRLWLF